MNIQLSYKDDKAVLNSIVVDFHLFITKFLIKNDPKLFQTKEMTAREILLFIGLWARLSSTFGIYVNACEMVWYYEYVRKSFAVLSGI